MKRPPFPTPTPTPAQIKRLGEAQGTTLRDSGPGSSAARNAPVAEEAPPPTRRALWRRFEMHKICLHIAHTRRTCICNTHNRHTDNTKKCETQTHLQMHTRRRKIQHSLTYNTLTRTTHLTHSQNSTTQYAPAQLDSYWEGKGEPTREQSGCRSLCSRAGMENTSLAPKFAPWFQKWLQTI